MNPKRRPLIFVPGIRTSTLAIKKDNGRGSSLEHFWPLLPHEFLAKDKLDRVFRLLETPVCLKADNKYDNDSAAVVATGLIPMAYDGLIRSILSWGYKLNDDFWIFPYDWRQSNSVSGQQLANFIEQQQNNKCGEDGVDIISHSMGGIITRAASHRYGAPIRRAAYIGCPHLGSPFAYFVLHQQINSQQFMGGSSFYPQQYTTATTNPWWLNNSSTTTRDGSQSTAKTLYQRRKELFIKFPSIYELLPDENYLAARPILFADNKPVLGIEDTYLRNDWAFETKEMQIHLKKAMQFKKDLGPELPGKDSDILIICGTDKLTCDTIGYQTHYQVPMMTMMNRSRSRRYTTAYVMQRGFSAPFDSGQHGDAYVPLSSAMASISGSQKYRNSVFIPEGHTTLPNTKTATEVVGRFLAS